MKWICTDKKGTCKHKDKNGECKIPFEVYIEEDGCPYRVRRELNE